MILGQNDPDVIHTKCFNALKAYRPQKPTVYYDSPEKQQSIIQEGTWQLGMLCSGI